MEQEFGKDEFDGKNKEIYFNQKAISKFRPRKRKPKIFLLVILAVFLVLVILFSFVKNRDGKVGNIGTELEVDENSTCGAKAIDMSLDDDNDGIVNAIEDILGLDRGNSDTDGDGYGDFQELSSGFDPLSNKKYTEEEWSDMKHRIKNYSTGLYNDLFPEEILQQSEEKTADDNADLEEGEKKLDNAEDVALQQNEENVDSE